MLLTHPTAINTRLRIRVPGRRPGRCSRRICGLRAARVFGRAFGPRRAWPVRGGDAADVLEGVASRPRPSTPRASSGRGWPRLPSGYRSTFIAARCVAAPVRSRWFPRTTRRWSRRRSRSRTPATYGRYDGRFRCSQRMSGTSSGRSTSRGSRTSRSRLDSGSRMGTVKSRSYRAHRRLASALRHLRQPEPMRQCA